MSIDIKLKTGFFETKPYRIKIINRALHFCPINSDCGDMFILNADSIVTVTLMQSTSKLEISTKNAIYSGFLDDDRDWIETFKFFKESLRAKIIYEYQDDKYGAFL